MKREHAMSWYVGRLVRLIWNVRRADGRVFAAGRVFRAYGHWRGRLNLEGPGAGCRAWSSPGMPMIRQVGFIELELVEAGDTGYCRICGCCDAHGCDLDVHGKSCSWADADHTLCTRCDQATRKEGGRHAQPQLLVAPAGATST